MGQVDRTGGAGPRGPGSERGLLAHARGAPGVVALGRCRPGLASAEPAALLAPLLGSRRGPRVVGRGSALAATLLGAAGVASAAALATAGVAPAAALSGGAGDLGGRVAQGRADLVDLELVESPVESLQALPLVLVLWY